MQKLTLQVKIQLTILFVLFTLFLSAQSKADYMIHHKNGKVYFEANVNIADIESIVMSPEYCEAGTSISFCLRNYFQQKLMISVNNGEPMDFVIEASLANSRLLQINLSCDQASVINSFQIENNAFVDEISTFQNEMSITLNGNVTKAVLDSTNRTVNVN